MLEILNRLGAKRFESLDNFFTTFGIYEDAARTRALKKLLIQNRRLVRGRTCVEAGAGLGAVTRILLDLGAERVFCVEENPAACEVLRKRFGSDRRVTVAHSPIEEFRPSGPVDFLFQELYGPLLLEESLLALGRLRFRPATVVPNEGALLMERVSLKRLGDPMLDGTVLKLLEGALVTDLVPGFRFRNPHPVLRWKYGQKLPPRFEIAPNAGPGEMLVFGIEIRHAGRKICGTADCQNWPYVFTPAREGRFSLSFAYKRGYAEALFRRRLC